ncbi:MAG: orotate phosphoribosyltransferase [Proteobacteria bacterium]|jgi:orotate phosphoribosyltransferase|nr:orotate phosphoribosyltransferase [Pseudomonadota bacterium]
MKDYQREFLNFAIQNQVLRFGEFELKSGRISPYFFNAGEFNNGAAMNAISRFFAASILDSGINFDVLFGPAYKGITLSCATAMALAKQNNSDVPYAYNRKEKKDHGEGGSTVGSALTGRVAIIDDVITAGTSIRESVEIIRSAGATPAAVFIALDRQEQSPDGEISAVDAVRSNYDMPVIAIARLAELLEYIKDRAEFREHWDAINAYREQYGVSD